MSNTTAMATPQEQVGNISSSMFCSSVCVIECVKQQLIRLSFWHYHLLLVQVDELIQMVADEAGLEIEGQLDEAGKVIFTTLYAADYPTTCCCCCCYELFAGFTYKFFV